MNILWWDYTENKIKMAERREPGKVHACQQSEVVFFLSDLCEDGCRVYCRDFSKVGQLIIFEMLQSKWVEKSRPKRNREFSYLCGEDGELFKILAVFNGKKIQIFNIDRCVSSSENVDEDFKLLELFENMSKGGSCTIGGACMDVFRNMLNGKKFRSLFPELTEEEYEDVKDAYKGGICECFKPGHYYDGITIDVHSMYPKQLRDCKLPAYRPVKCEEKPDGLYIVNFDACITVKQGGFPFLVDDDGFGGNKSLLLSTFGDIRNFTLTSVEFDMVEDNYNIDFISVNYFYAFRSVSGVFSEYVDLFYNIKKKNTGARRTMAKLFLNNLVGKFAKKKTVNVRKYSVDSGLLRFEEEEGKACKTCYVPVAAFVNSYAKRMLVEDAKKVGLENVIYCDTDSLHLKNKECMKCIDIGDDLGMWGIEKEWREGIYFGKKKYVTDEKMCMAGFPDSENKRQDAYDILNRKKDKIWSEFTVFDEFLGELKRTRESYTVSTDIKKASKSKLAGWIYENRA